MGDFGSTTFGYAIAYLLPGFTAVVGSAFISEHIGRLFSLVIEKQNLALGLMGALGALAVGLFLSLFRALVFEEGIGRSQRLSANDYASLADDEQTYNAYHRMVDEIYRFHQLWGGMAFALPLLAIGVLSEDALSEGEKTLVGITFVAFEGAAVWGAIATFKRYLVRSRKFLAES